MQRIGIPGGLPCQKRPRNQLIATELKDSSLCVSGSCGEERKLLVELGGSRCDVRKHGLIVFQVLKAGMRKRKQRQVAITHIGVLYQLGGLVISSIVFIFEYMEEGILLTDKSLPTAS